jgi:hypothetical protein
MKMSTYERNFLDQATIGYSDFIRYRPKSKLDSLHERKKQLNKKFEFTTETLFKIEKINEFLLDKLLKAYNTAELMEEELTCKQHLNENFISDYEIEFRLSLFSKEKYSGIEDLEGNPFFTYKPSLLFFYKKNGNSTQKDIDDYKNRIKSTNYNDYPIGHPLHNQHHNIILHDLEDHTILAWQDIIDIEEIWFEVIVNVQNIFEVKMNN